MITIEREKVQEDIYTTNIFTDEEKEIGFKQTWTFTPKKNHLIAELPFFGKEYTVMFDIFINKITFVESVLHIGLGGNMEKYGDRNPAIFVNKAPWGIHVASSISGNLNYWKNPSVELNKWISVEVSQTLRDGKVGITYHS